MRLMKNFHNASKTLNETKENKNNKQVIYSMKTHNALKLFKEF